MSSTSFQNFANLKIALLICCPAHVLYCVTSTSHQKHHFHSQILLEISQTYFQFLFQIMEIVDAVHSSVETSESGEPRILLMLLKFKLLLDFVDRLCLKSFALLRLFGNLYDVTHSITYSLTHLLIFLYLLLLLLCCIRCFCCFCCCCCFCCFCCLSLLLLLLLRFLLL